MVKYWKLNEMFETIDYIMYLINAILKYDIELGDLLKTELGPT